MDLVVQQREEKVKKKSSSEIEKALLPRLRFIGCVLLLFGAFSCAYALIAEPYLSTVGLDDVVGVGVQEELMGLPEIDETPGFIVTSFERINLYLVAFVFGAIGSSCLFIFWKKRKAFNAIVENGTSIDEEKKPS